MRSPRRNMSSIFYSLYDENSKVDKWGNKVGGYGEPTLLKISLSAEKGSSSNEVFGQELDYDREMVTTNMECPIDEFSHLWIDVDTSKPYDYIVKKVAKTKKQKRYAIKRVNVNYENQD